MSEGGAESGQEKSHEATPQKLERVADEMIADLHGSPEYRAHLIKVMTGRAVTAAA